MQKIKIISSILLVAATITFVYAGNFIRTKKTTAGELQQPADIISNTDDMEIESIKTDDNPWQELEKLAETYYSKGGTTYKGAMWLTDDNADKEKMIEQQEFEYTLLGNEFQYKLGAIEMISTRDYIITVDHAAKTIALTRQSNTFTPGNIFDIAAFKKAMEQKNAAAKVEQAGKEKILTIDSIDDPSIQGYHIYYSPETYRMNKIVMGMVRAFPLEEETKNEVSVNEENPVDTEGYYYYLTIQFRSSDNIDLKKRDFHPERKFISITKENITVNPAYRDYELMSHIEQ